MALKMKGYDELTFADDFMFCKVLSSFLRYVAKGIPNSTLTLDSRDSTLGYH